MYKPTFDSLTENFHCSEWFRDAKFGIWSHWGPQSVPMAGDWYARNMYCQGSAQYNHHLRHYGHPSKVGYKDICAMWKAERFDPDRLMQLYVDAGARYFVAQAMHHDNFFNFPSRFNPYNAVQMGPHKDILGMWKQAADSFGLPFGITEHLGASYSFFAPSKGCDSYGPYAGVPYDGCDSQYKDLYLDNAELLGKKETVPFEHWYTTDKSFHAYWLAVMKELIDQYEPDLLYSDGTVPFGIFEYSPAEDPLFSPGLEAVAYLYNASAKKHGENRAVYTSKDERPDIYNVGILDIERSQLPEILATPWQTDTCVGGWFYNDRCDYKKPGHVIEILVDIISKNGTLLLNIPQLPDGSIDDEEVFILSELGKWFRCCGEGVYHTRPWRVSGEGASRVVRDGFKEDAVAWSEGDIRFTQKGDTVYAFLLRAPENRVAILKSFTAEDHVRSVKLLGGAECNFNNSMGPLVVQLPPELPTEYVNCIAIKM